MTALHCTRCGKPLLSAAVLVQTKTGPLALGPKCAMRAGLIERNTKKRASHAASPKVARREQRDWVDEAIAAAAA